MDRKNSITLSGITNLLESGALLRRGDQWILIEGPFSEVSDANSDEITIFSPDFYDLASGGLVRGQRTWRLSTEDLREICEEYLAHSRPLGTKAFREWQEPAKSDFSTALNHIRNRIEKQDIQKAVPVIFARSPQPVTVYERAQMILTLLLAPPTLFVYGIWQDADGVLGATPETLFEYQRGVLKTMALAGTCPKSEAATRESLLQDAKEMHEHQLVVEDIVQVLSPLGSVRAEETRVLELPTLYHLQTPIEVTCEQMPDFLELVKRLHPTPALGVAPRGRGYHWMQELPGQEGRARYGAPFAFLSRTEALCLVGIRNIQWNKHISMIGSGCGIVAASELEREWQELFQKRLSVKKILGLDQ